MLVIEETKENLITRIKIQAKKGGPVTCILRLSNSAGSSLSRPASIPLFTSPRSNTQSNIVIRTDKCFPSGNYPNDDLTRICRGASELRRRVTYREVQSKLLSSSFSLFSNHLSLSLSRSHHFRRYFPSQSKVSVSEDPIRNDP
jgi:hypothetical protein